jgi:cyclophilin family peptidyl-prolyl cis-trans isomerase
MKIFLLLCCFALAATQNSSANPVVRFQTDLGNIDVLLLPDVAPRTVANFLGYVNRSAYDNSFIHRSPPQFVVQGGGYRYVNNSVVAVPQDPPVMNEFHVSNTRGTLAMAKLGGNPDSATNQWFFNESDNNAPNLDNQNGGFTVFGRILSTSGLSVMDAIAALPIYNAGSPFDQLPLRNYVSGNIQDANLVHVISVKIVGNFLLSISRPSPDLTHIQGQGVPGTTYRIESSATPAAATFTLLATVTADASGNISYDHTNPGQKQFYRLANL